MVTAPPPRLTALKHDLDTSEAKFGELRRSIA